MAEIDLEYQKSLMLNSLQEESSNRLRNSLYDLVGVLEFRKMQRSY